MTTPTEPPKPKDESRRPVLTLIDNSFAFDADTERASALLLLAFLKNPLGPETEEKLAALEARTQPRGKLSVVRPTRE